MLCMVCCIMVHSHFLAGWITVHSEGRMCRSMCLTSTVMSDQLHDTLQAAEQLRDQLLNGP